MEETQPPEIDWRTQATIDIIYQLGLGVEAYILDFGHAPVVSAAELPALFIERRIDFSPPPVVDAWGQPIMYLCGDDGSFYVFTSNGPESLHSVDRDIVWYKGRFVQRPKSRFDEE